jgi:Transmembrane secretion effector
MKAHMRSCEDRDFLVYLIECFGASLGSQMLVVAVGWELYERTHAALALGLVGPTNVVPMFLFTLPARHFADSHDRKRIIVWTPGVMALSKTGECNGGHN